MRMSTTNNILVALASIHIKLSYDYSLTICFSRRFPCMGGQSFSQCKPLQIVNFCKVGRMQICTQRLTRIHEKKFEGGGSHQNGK